MDANISKAKLSKKAKRALALVGRRTWGEMNPVTRKPKNSKAYDRRKAQKGVGDLRFGPSLFNHYFQ